MCFSLRFENGGALPGVFSDITMLDTAHVNTKDSSHTAARYLRRVAADSAGKLRIEINAPRAIFSLSGDARGFPPEPAWSPVAMDSVVMYDVYLFFSSVVHLRILGSEARGILIARTDEVDPDPRKQPVIGARVSCP